MAESLMLQSGFVIDVPITLSVAVRGADSMATAKRVARLFADSLGPETAYVESFSEEIAKRFPGAAITEAFLESSREETCKILEELESE